MLHKADTMSGTLCTEYEIGFKNKHSCLGIVTTHAVLLLICCRILELKNEMVLLEYSEYHYFDDVLSDLKLTPVSNTTHFMYNKIIYLKY